MKLKIHDVEYEIKPIPPSLGPYHARITDLLQGKPQNVQEAKDWTAELQILVKELLKETVKPEPPEEYELEAYNTLIQVTKNALENSQFFPRKQTPHLKKSGAAGPTAPQTSE
jgi:hypothetical protein